jgi:hypothetical protein
VSLLLAATVLTDCGDHPSPVSPSVQSPSPVGPLASSTAGPSSGVLVGAGDIAKCGTPGAEATARLLDRLPGTVFAAGDIAYDRGTSNEFIDCYEPSWGRHRARTRPVPGNHEYMSGAAAYYSYFGDKAGPGTQGYYSYSVGPWRVIALNSEVPSGPGSPQGAWLAGELSANGSRCTAVYWHRPLFSSGRAGDNPDMRELWRTLYGHGVDVVINGHDHTYERFAPQDPDGRPDFQRGIRQFVVGTGGAPLFEFRNIHPNSEVRAAVWGVTVFTLYDGGYEWRFVPVDGETFADSGSGSCH